jgi:hypothetical protein
MRKLMAIQMIYRMIMTMQKMKRMDKNTIIMITIVTTQII